MTTYIISRVFQALLVVIGVSLVTFIIMHMLPGGPAQAMLGPTATPQQIHTFIVQNGYNQPIFVQYWRYVVNVVHGNLGYSYHYNQTVASLLGQDLPKTALLVGLAMAVAVLVAIPLGVLQAVRRNRPVDYVFTAASFVGYAMPTFWLGILLVLAFAIYLPWLPPEAPQGTTVGAILQQPAGLILPVTTLAVVSLAAYSRFVRSSLIENLAQDYVRTARAKGASERRVLFGHILRNSLIPIVTLIGLSLPAVVSGAIITESVFNYPGMGLLFWTAATTHDYPVLMGTSIVVATATVIGNLIADVLYAVVDPRVRRTGSGLRA
jgi:peptide/nickel transport system permease protein